MGTTAQHCCTAIQFDKGIVLDLTQIQIAVSFISAVSFIWQANGATLIISQGSLHLRFYLTYHTLLKFDWIYLSTTFRSPTQVSLSPSILPADRKACPEKERGRRESKSREGRGERERRIVFFKKEREKRIVFFKKDKYNRIKIDSTTPSYSTKFFNKK